MIIDFRHTPPTDEGLARYVNPPPHLQGYAERYGERVYGGSNAEVTTMSAVELLARLDQLGIDMAVLKSADNESTHGTKYPLERLAAYVDGHGDRLFPVAGVDPHKGMVAVREVEWAVRELGFRGVNLGPFEQRLRANDALYFPIYAKCVEFDIPVLLHTGVNFSSGLSLDFGHPRHLDDVAVAFPDLKIVAVHGGWPWVLETVAVAWRHRNVFIDISGVRPRYILKPGSGWEPLLNYGASVLADRVLWGSNWPQVAPEEWLAAIDSFPLSDDVRAKWLGGNAARLLGIT